MNAWGLTNQSMTEDPWDYQHITTFNFLPFVLRRIGEAPRWSPMITALWSATVLALFSLLIFIGNQARLGKLAALEPRVGGVLEANFRSMPR